MASNKRHKDHSLTYGLKRRQQEHHTPVFLFLHRVEALLQRCEFPLVEIVDKYACEIAAASSRLAGEQ
jgi:hypothetical protein